MKRHKEKIKKLEKDIAELEQQKESFCSKKTNQAQIQQQIVLILTLHRVFCLSQLFNQRQLKDFVARLQENPRLLDNVFDSRNFKENPEEITLEGFFRFHSEEDLLATTEGIITQLNTLNYEMISRKQDYLD